jgi:hypothetical protein
MSLWPAAASLSVVVNGLDLPILDCFQTKNRFPWPISE